MPDMTRPRPRAGGEPAGRLDGREGRFGRRAGRGANNSLRVCSVASVCLKIPSAASAPEPSPNTVTPHPRGRPSGKGDGGKPGAAARHTRLLSAARGVTTPGGGLACFGGKGSPRPRAPYGTLPDWEGIPTPTQPTTVVHTMTTRRDADGISHAAAIHARRQSGLHNTTTRALSLRRTATKESNAVAPAIAVRDAAITVIKGRTSSGSGRGDGHAFCTETSTQRGEVPAVHTPKRYFHHTLRVRVSGGPVRAARRQDQISMVEVGRRAFYRTPSGQQKTPRLTGDDAGLISCQWARHWYERAIHENEDVWAKQWKQLKCNRRHVTPTPHLSQPKRADRIAKPN